MATSSAIKSSVDMRGVELDRLLKAFEGLLGKAAVAQDIAKIAVRPGRLRLERENALRQALQDHEQGIDDDGRQPFERLIDVLSDPFAYRPGGEDGC